MITPEEKTQIETASPLSLFRRVFGFASGQTLSEFAKECSTLREDKQFIAEVRAYALAQ